MQLLARQFRTLRATAAVFTLVVATPVGALAASTPKAGATCTKSKVGKVAGNLQCTKVGKVYKWTPIAVASAPATPPGDTPPLTTAPPRPVANASIVVDSTLKAALETALGGQVTFKSTCTKANGCSVTVLFPDSDAANPSLLTIGAMPANVFQNQLQGLQLVRVENPEFQTWSDRGRGVYFMPRQPVDKFITHYSVTLTITSGVPNGAPIFSARDERLLAAAKAVEAFVLTAK